MPLTNWAGNLTYSAQEVLEPSSVEELQEMVASRPKVRALGSRHSFSDIADTEHTLISTARLTGIGEVADGAITVEAGVRYGDLCSAIRPLGLALHNLASLPHISIAGACATATHGSGIENRNLCDAVLAMDFVLADGSIWTVRKGDPDFEGAVVHLGALGVVARLTLNLQPAFAVYQTIYDYLPLSELEQGFDAVMGAAYSVSLFTTWTGPVIDQVWAKSLSPNPAELFGARAATEPRHPIRGMPADFCTSQLNEPGQWDERLAHFKMEFTPSSGEELQSEYFVPRESAWAALQSIRDLADQIAPHLHISEVRAIKTDNLWLSPAYEADVIGIHFTWKPHTADVMRLLPQIEDRLRQLRRPHWGKLFTWDRLAASYPRAQDFRALRQRLDPTGKFDNGYLQRVLS